MQHRALAAVLALLQLVPVLGTADLSAGDPLVIDIIMIDRGLFQGGYYDKMVSADPSISVLGVPMPGHYSIGNLQMDADYMNRVLRIYMPRNFEHLTTTQDMILLREACCGSIAFPEVYFDAKWMSWFVRGVQEEGMPLGMWGGDASWGGGGEGDYTSWGETILDVVLPFESIGNYNPPYASTQYPRFRDPQHPLARLPWEAAGPVELLNKVEPKQGATLVAEAIKGTISFPWIAWWTSGEGRVLGETQVFGSMGTTNKMLNDWEWYQDFLIYLVYFNAGKPIPPDVYRAHRLREEINTHLAKGSLLISLLEFIEKFGASTVRLYEEFEAINLEEARAEEFYRQDDYDSAAEVFEEVHLMWNELNGRAIQVKEHALLWVYLIEWLSVTSVALIAGSFLWMVMIRRRLYREAGTTRIREPA
jgi:hypothetical protein